MNRVTGEGSPLGNPHEHYEHIENVAITMRTMSTNMLFKPLINMDRVEIYDTI